MTDKIVQIAKMVTELTYGEMREFSDSLRDTISEVAEWTLPEGENWANAVHVWAENELDRAQEEEGQNSSQKAA